MAEMYRGYKIVSHYRDDDQDGETLHFHHGTPGADGRVEVPMGCAGPASAAERAAYGPNAGGVPTLAEARAAVDLDIALGQMA
jgi:hypothetical protein